MEGMYIYGMTHAMAISISRELRYDTLNQENEITSKNLL